MFFNFFLAAFGFNVSKSANMYDQNNFKKIK
jgi:hypothetical protein